MLGERYQISLIALGVLATVLVIAFFMREVAPEYIRYQEAYVALEEFRSTYTGEPVPPFQYGIKQLVLEREDKGPATIDRCTSCHVALQFEHFSPTKIAHDVNGKIVFDEGGVPVKIPNPDNVWTRLEKAVSGLRDPQVNEQLIAQGEGSRVDRRLEEANVLEHLRYTKVGEHTYDMTKVLRMHPLMGRETRPFEYHPVSEYGCTTCHNGEGRGLTTEKAHGPVLDGMYEEAFEGPKPQFIELDADNDPRFSQVFNAKPGHELLFQTSPIFVGALIQAKCVQCHQGSTTALEGVFQNANTVTKWRVEKADAIQQAFVLEEDHLLAVWDLREQLKTDGLEATLKSLKEQAEDYRLPADLLDQAQAQLRHLKGAAQETQALLAEFNETLQGMIGSEELFETLAKSLKEAKQPKEALQQFLEENEKNPNATGTLFKKFTAANLEDAVRRHVLDTASSLKTAVNDSKATGAIESDIDLLTKNYYHGQQLYISQGCYACHRIAGFSRGGVGPEHTEAGNNYPWFLKESVVWPQADLPTSTMPNYKLDHDELEDLMTFMLGQKGGNKTVAETAYKIGLQEWEAGKKLPWEKPVTPAQMHDLTFSMTVFATEGCAACHRLRGFESNVGFEVEKAGKPNFDTLYAEEQWFQKLIPERISSKELVNVIEANAQEIDKRIVEGVRENSLVEALEAQDPSLVNGLYTVFKFALRAKNAHFKTLLSRATTPKEKQSVLANQKAWKERVNRVMKMFIQQYGFGRLIGPRPNWSGIYRTDEWLMEHFRNPSAHTARSIMPVMPFDDTKFYALTYMLDVLGIRNRDAVREVWDEQGFNPEQTYQVLCSQCHGEFLQGNGPVSEWIYPIPKNLRNADFLRNLTRENAIESIKYGVKGTPMPPWGEAAKDKPTADGKSVLTDQEINKMVDWLFSFLRGSQVIRGMEDVPKWQYTPEDAVEELEQEGESLQKKKKEDLLSLLPTGKGYLAALDPPTQRLTTTASDRVTDVFDVVDHPVYGEEKKGYYIKKQYYSAENLEEGQQFFEMNCAVCHGREADGTGARAATMYDAKPRMLTNLNWLHTRDDLRLLRSIKYGVAGTSMTPWGDLTTSMQRMQLVMYIRTLSEDQQFRDELYSMLYNTFDRAGLTLEQARVKDYQVLVRLQEQLNEIQQRKEELYREVQEGKVPTGDAVGSYEEELELAQKLQSSQNVDALLSQMKELVQEERNLYRILGITLISKRGEQRGLFDNYLKLIGTNEGRFVLKEGHLTLNVNHTEEFNTLKQQLIDSVAAKREKLEKEQYQLGGRIHSAQRNETLDALNEQIRGFIQLEQQLISGLEEATRNREKQAVLYNAYQEKLQEIRGSELTL